LTHSIHFSLFDFPRIFSVIKSTDSLKRNQTRPLRAEIIELAIEKYSHGQLSYVGNTAVGKDFHTNTNPSYAIECKSMEGLFQSNSPFTKSIILANFRQSKVSELRKTFDYILLVDTKRNSVGICDWNTCTENVIINDANASVVIDQNKVQMIVENVIPCSESICDFSNKLFQLIRESI